MPWLNQEWCQSPTECDQLVIPRLLLLLLLLFVVYRELIFKSVCGLQLRGQDVHRYIHIWEVTMEIIYLRRKYVVKVDLYFHSCVCHLRY